MIDDFKESGLFTGNLKDHAQLLARTYKLVLGWSALDNDFTITETADRGEFGDLTRSAESLAGSNEPEHFEFTTNAEKPK